jgi:outer membrane protein OmpA-like peptidoglycan-associated protein
MGGTVYVKKVVASVFLCTMLFAGFVSTARAADDDDDFADHEVTWASNVPSISYWGLRGLSQTVSAEPLGAGRFNLALSTSYFKQKQEIFSPGVGANVFTGRGAFSWGLNDEIDLFGVTSYYLTSNDGVNDGIVASLGALTGGFQYSFKIPRDVPFRLALQLGGSVGVRTGMGGDNSTRSDNEVTTNEDYWREDFDNNWSDHSKDNKWSYAGYDFYDARTRDQLDIIIKLAQTFILGEYVNIHLNEGILTTINSYGHLFLFAAGLQVDPTDFLTLGLELNWRTPFKNFAFSDPLWLTPTVAYRSPYHIDGLAGVGITGGIDICISQKKDWVRNEVATSGKPLESWRVFGDVLLSFDRYASRRAEIERERMRNEAERARLRRMAQLSDAQRDSIAARAREDSLRLVAEMHERAAADSIRAQHVVDSLAAEMAERARQDSLAHAAAHAQLLAEAESQRIADSLALAEAQRRLEEERAKRSEAEQNLLSTGMLVLDAVYFETGRADIHRNSMPYLTTIARMLVKYPKLRIEIGGHTDNTGSHETNVRLSQQRAEAVFMFMHNAEPALAQMLTAKGYGPTSPKADNATAAGREANRRVELRVLNPDVLEEYK